MATANSDEVRLAPFPGGQTDYLRRAEYEVLFGGETGPGKTAMLVLDAAGYQYEFGKLGKKAVDIPSYRAVLFRRKTTHLAKLIDEADKFYKPFGAQFVYHRKGDPGSCYTFPYCPECDKICKVPHHRQIEGAKIFLCHLEDEKNKYDHDGQEYQFVGFDELQQFTITQFLYLQSRLRSTVQYLSCRVRATAMPVGSGVIWVKKRYRLDEPLKRRYYTQGDLEPTVNPRGVEVVATHEDARARVFVPGYLEENLAVNKAEYRSNVKLLGKRFERAMLHHDWDAFSGDFFKEFDFTTELIDPFVIPKEWRLICADDPGWGGTCAAGLLAQDFTGKVYLISTYYERARRPQDNAEGISKFWKNCRWTAGREPELFVSGLDAWAKKDKNAIQADERTFADVFYEHGMVLTKAVTDRYNGWGAMQALMPENFFVFKGENDPFIDELVSAEADENDQHDIKGKGNDPQVIDHALDFCRYGIMSLDRVTPTTAKTLEEDFNAAFVRQFEREHIAFEGDEDFRVGRFT